MSACDYNATLGLLLATNAWATVTRTVLKGFRWLSLSLLGLLSPFDRPGHQVSAWLCLVQFPFLLRTELFLLTLSFSSANKLSLLLLFVFTSSMATLASKALLLSWVFLPFISPAFFLNSHNCWCCAIDIESYFSLEYFNTVFPLKVLWVAVVFCHLAGLFWSTEVTFTLGVNALLSMYWMRRVTTASKFFLHLSKCALTAAVENLSY